MDESLQMPEMDDYMETLSNMAPIKMNKPKRRGKPMKLKNLRRPELMSTNRGELEMRKGLLEDYEDIKEESDNDESTSTIVDGMLMNEYENISNILKESKRGWKSMLMSSIPTQYLSEFGERLNDLDGLIAFYEKGWSDTSDKIYTWIINTGHKYAEKGYDFSKQKATPNKNVVKGVKEFYKFLEAFMTRNSTSAQDKNILKCVKSINKNIGQK